MPSYFFSLFLSSLVLFHAWNPAWRQRSATFAPLRLHLSAAAAAAAAFSSCALELTTVIKLILNFALLLLPSYVVLFL